MVRIPLPSVPQQPVQSGRYAAPAVVPQQDATGRQLAVLGQGLQQVGFEASRRADWQQDQLERAQLDDADNLTADAARDVKMAYRALIGRDATGDARKKAEEDLDKRIAKIGASLNPEVQAAWKPRANARRAAAVESMAGHEADQTLNYRKGALAAGIEASRIDGLKSEMVRQSRELSDLLGEDEAQSRMRELDETTKYHEDRIRILAKKDPSAASAMLTEASAAKEIHPSRLDDLQGLIKQSAAEEKAAALFRTIVAEPTRQEMPLSEQKRIALAIVNYELDNKNVTADVWKETTSLIDHHFAQQQQILTQQKAESLQQAETIFAKDKAATTETLPSPMQEVMERLGIFGDVSQKEAEVRAREFVGSKRELQDAQLDADIKTMARLDALIKHLDEVDPPPEADAATAKKFTDYIEKQRAAAMALKVALGGQVASKLGVEIAEGPPPKSDTKRSTEEQLRDIINAVGQGLAK